MMGRRIRRLVAVGWLGLAAGFAGAASPEPLLDRVFSAIEANQLGDALAHTEKLLAQYPNFRLGHLIKGDLLLARSRPLTTLGDTRSGSREQLDGLREEALVRLRGYRDKPPQDYVPRYLMQMPAHQKYAIVVDTEKSRLYLYENMPQGPRFVADYYVTQGKLGADKLREGDKKTPIGVYHVTDSLPRTKLADLYGNGAFPLNYPNVWDRRTGRTGNGIWLHGTPSDTFSRPPKASDGCVVLANADLDAIAKSVQVGTTPVIISNSIEWLSLDDWARERSELNAQIEAWRKDWESTDVERYLTHYSSRFEAGKVDFGGFSRQKRQVAAGKSWITVTLGNTSMFRNPGKEELVVVTFEQDYRSNNLSDRMRKQQYWIREDGRWKIIYEGAA